LFKGKELFNGILKYLFFAMLSHEGFFREEMDTDPERHILLIANCSWYSDWLRAGRQRNWSFSPRRVKTGSRALPPWGKATSA
jgi:hypothetical protein